METPKRNIIIRPLIGTIALLMIPLLFTLFQIPVFDPGQGFEQLAWGGEDFVVMGLMLFTAGLLLELAARKFGKHRVVAMAVIVIGFFWLWAELAVGVFTNWGS